MLRSPARRASASCRVGVRLIFRFAPPSQCRTFPLDGNVKTLGMSAGGHPRYNPRPGARRPDAQLGCPDDRQEAPWQSLPGVAARNPSGSATTAGGQDRLTRLVARRRHGVDGDRSRPGLLRGAGGRTDRRDLLHEVGHAFLRAGLCVPRRHRSLSPRPQGGHPGSSRFLFTRGLALVLMEVTIIRLSWTFSLAP